MKLKDGSFYYLYIVYFPLSGLSLQSLFLWWIILSVPFLTLIFNSYDSVCQCLNISGQSSVFPWWWGLCSISTTYRLKVNHRENIPSSPGLPKDLWLDGFISGFSRVFEVEDRPPADPYLIGLKCLAYHFNTSRKTANLELWTTLSHQCITRARALHRGQKTPVLVLVLLPAH